MHQEHACYNSRRLEHDVDHLVIIRVPRIRRLLVADFDRLGATTRARRVREQLSLYAPVHCAEQECSTVHGLGHGQVPMILQNDTFRVP